MKTIETTLSWYKYSEVGEPKGRSFLMYTYSGHIFEVFSLDGINYINKYTQQSFSKDEIKYWAYLPKLPEE